MTSIDQESIQTCRVCTVKLSLKSVFFSTGYQGTRAQLYARVCQYVRDSRCLNQDQSLIGDVLREDGFPNARDQ